jgi:5-oxoprolinase (ATP-hydrolysing) subunit C
VTALRILRAGPLCTVQDAGRQGYLRFGVTPAGPMDWFSHAVANRLIGNPPGTSAIEVGPAGLSFEVDAPIRLAIAAPGFRVLRRGSAVPAHVVLNLRPGMSIDLQPGPWGVWGYVALPGGIAGVPVMGSMASHLRSGLGPRALQPGDTVAAAGADISGPETCLVLPVQRETPPLRYVPGPQDDLFAPATHHTLQTASFRVSPRSDRMAYRLSGPPLPAIGAHDIVSDGIAMGAIQVPGDGQPFVLMADRQPTGGYPKIGTVIRADIARLAQMRAGQPLTFTPVTVAQAVTALEGAMARLEDLPQKQRPMRFLSLAGA